MSDWRVLTRRWYVLVAGVLITAGLAFVAASAVSVQHEVTANVLMLPPRSVNEDGKVTNPYLDLGGLEGVADVVCKTLSEESVTKSLKAISPNSTYTVMRDSTSAAPVILITVDANSQQGALAIQQALLDRIPQTLAAIQRSSSVRSDALISSTVLTKDTTSTTIQKSRIRALVVVMVGGLGLTVLSAALLDGILRSRRTARTGAGAQRGVRAPIPGLLDESGPAPQTLAYVGEFDETGPMPQAMPYAAYSEEPVVRSRTAPRPQAAPAPVRSSAPRNGGPTSAAPTRQVRQTRLAPVTPAPQNKNAPHQAGQGGSNGSAVAGQEGDPMTQPSGISNGSLTLRKIPKRPAP